MKSDTASAACAASLCHGLASASGERDANLHRAAAPVVNSNPEPVKERPPAPASVPSFLGLSQEQNPYPDRSLDYLLEDEPEPSRTRMYLAIVLLVAAVAMLGWRWRHSGFFSQTHPAVVTTPGNPTPNSPDASAPETSATPAGSAPATSSNPETATSNPPVPAKHGSPRESDLPANGAPTDEASKSVQPEQPSGTGPEDSSNAAAKPDTASTTTTANPVPAEKPAAIPPPVAKVTPRAPRAAPAQVVPTASLQDPSETEGEKYLYGHGVPQNCARAEKSLLSAAQHANPKAQSVLGTMYATGHCVGRDLPTAYRWFAKASHQDPNNDRITRDLEVLWKQMTPGERQLAVNNRE